MKPDWKLLHIADFVRLIEGGAAFETAWRDTFSRLEKIDTGSGCNRTAWERNICRSARSRLFQDSQTLGTEKFERRTRRPFIFLKDLETQLESETGDLCRGCRLLVQNHARIAKQELWKSLPKAFSLVSLSAPGSIAVSMLIHVVLSQVDIVGPGWGAEEGP